MTNDPVERAIERLCQKGCKAVWQDIAAMDEGEIVPELLGLSARERQRVLQEIKSIMAVYRGRCKVDS